MADHEAVKTASPLFSNRTYEILKWFVQLVLPASATAYAGLGALWHWANVTEVVGTITIITTFLGVILLISNRAYNKSDDRYDGVLVPTPADDEDPPLLKLTSEVDDLVGKKEFAIKVLPPQFRPKASSEDA